MSREAAKRVLLLALRSGLGILFVIAGVTKLWDPSAFAIAIANYRFLPMWRPSSQSRCRPSRSWRAPRCWRRRRFGGGPRRFVWQGS